MKLSVIIVSYNSEAYLEHCIRSVQAHFPKTGYEIILVDNCSQDGTRAIAQKFPDIIQILRNENGGFAKALNDGLRIAKGEYCLWLNPDTEIRNGGIEDLLRYMDREKQVNVAGARILNPDGSVQLSCRSFPGFATAVFNRYSLLTRLFPRNPLSRKYLNSDFDHQTIKKVDWVSGACLLHRREILAQTGFPDDDFFMFCEDVDFCLRASKKSGQVIYFPPFEVMHHIGGSGKGMRRRLIAEHHRSMWKYYKKNYKRNFMLDLLTRAAISARCSFKILLTFLGRGPS